MAPQNEDENDGKFSGQKGRMGCKWPSLDAPGIRFHLSHPILELGETPNNWPSGGNKKWLPSMKMKKMENFHNKLG